MLPRGSRGYDSVHGVVKHEHRWCADDPRVMARRAINAQGAAVTEPRPLPVEAIRALSDIYFHDALFVSGRFHSRSGRMSLRFVIGDLQRGYETLLVTYLGSRFRGQFGTAKRILCQPRGEILAASLVGAPPRPSCCHRAMRVLS